MDLGCFAWISLVLFFSAGVPAKAQDAVEQRIIFIGDAGKIDSQQAKVLQSASTGVIPGKTLVMFLGDNIYPSGLGLPGSSNEEQTKRILQAQFRPMRDNGASVYFVPGNHDWDKMGRNGLQKIRQQGKYLADQQDSLLQLVPADGCPDPVELQVSPDVTIIAFDSEWWLFKYDKTNVSCSCQNTQNVLQKMSAIFERNRGKTIFLACHHPFQSYGHHGGFFSLKDHLFPLTAIKNYLYIPLPVIGSLYPLLRRSIKNPEDLHHRAYKTMIRQVDSVFNGYTKLIHVSGHEHGLQYMDGNQKQIVSGAGSKNAFIKRRKAKFSDAHGGYVTVDLLSNKRITVRFMALKNGHIETVYAFSQP